MVRPVIVPTAGVAVDVAVGVGVDVFVGAIMRVGVGVNVFVGPIMRVGVDFAVAVCVEAGVYVGNSVGAAVCACAAPTVGVSCVGDEPQAVITRQNAMIGKAVFIVTLL
jgi:hypothetical protein